MARRCSSARLDTYHRSSCGVVLRYSLYAKSRILSGRLWRDNQSVEHQATHKSCVSSLTGLSPKDLPHVSVRGAPILRLAIDPKNLGEVVDMDPLARCSPIKAADRIGGNIAAGRIATLQIDLPERGFDLLTKRRRHRSRAAGAFMDAL